MSTPSTVRASVIIVSYNNRRDLEHGLPGIVASLGADDELILVDNASQDGSAAWVQQAFPSIQVILSETNLGFGGANNLAVERAAGEYLAFINPDTAVEPGWLDALIAALKTNPGIHLTTSRIVLMSAPSIVNTCGNNVHLSGITLCRGMGRSSAEYKTPAPVSAVSGAAFAISRTLFQRLGGFDAEFFLYMEDTDLSMRARLAGCSIAYVPESIVQHAYELRFGISKTYFQERNRYLMLLKLFRWGTLFILFPVFLLSEVVTWGYVLLHERDRLGNKWRAYKWVISNWQNILARRRQVQRTRRIPDRALIAEMSSHLAITQVDSGLLGKIASSFSSVLFFVLKIWTRCWVWW